MFLSLSLDQLPTHYCLHFHCCGVSLRFPFMWSFCWCYFLWDIFTLFITTTLHIYITRFAFICSSHGIQESLKEWHHQYFHGQLFLLWLHLSLSFMSNIIIFFFFAAFLFFLGSSPLWSSHGFISGTRGRMATCFAACVCELSSKCAGTSHQQILREVMQLVSDLDKSLSFT